MVDENRNIIIRSINILHRIVDTPITWFRGWPYFSFYYV